MVNDFTVASLLDPGTHHTFLDPSIQSVDTDLCRNLSSLDAYLGSRTTTRPVFAYLAPMNVHILNTRTAAAPSGGSYEGFYPPYAAALERLDGCFGAFVDTLRQRGLYDDSVIILTSDHGDSLGEEGRWGHQFYLYPEDLRVPLIVHVPPALQSRVTTDLGRLSFLTDLTPSLYGLLGYDVRDLGEGFGHPLFVPPDEAPAPRRRGSYLVMSSYGSSYGLLRRNGRQLYHVDLVNRAENAFVLLDGPLGEAVPVTDAVRRVNRAGILDGLRAVERMYR
ncbi:MAG: sulfatase-like hydrolase/transferase [Vicinamibacterales bacterium]